MIKIKFNQEMIISWFLMSIILLAQSYVYLGIMDPHVSSEIKLVQVGICILHPGILIYFIRAFRGPNRDWRDHSAEASKLSTLGYLWRAFIAYYTGVLILALIRIIIPFNLPNKSSALEIALWEVPILIASSLGIWLLFSRDRRGQAQVLVSMFRGY
jgi:hypothetical protein